MHVNVLMDAEVEMDNRSYFVHNNKHWTNLARLF